MVQIVGYHVTRTACRESIRQNGLLPNRPTQARPYGVYVFRMDGGFDHAIVVADRHSSRRDAEVELPARVGEESAERVISAAL